MIFVAPATVAFTEVIPSFRKLICICSNDALKLSCPLHWLIHPSILSLSFQVIWLAVYWPSFDWTCFVWPFCLLLIYLWLVHCVLCLPLHSQPMFVMPYGQGSSQWEMREPFLFSPVTRLFVSFFFSFWCLSFKDRSLSEKKNPGFREE